MRTICVQKRYSDGIRTMYLEVRSAGLIDWQELIHDDDVVVKLDVWEPEDTLIYADGGVVAVMEDNGCDVIWCQAAVYRGGERWFVASVSIADDDLVILDYSTAPIAEFSRGVVTGVVLDRNPVMQVAKLVERYGVASLAYAFATSPDECSDTPIPSADALVGYAATLWAFARRGERLARLADSLELPDGVELLAPLTTTFEMYMPGDPTYVVEAAVTHPCKVDGRNAMCTVRVELSDAEADAMYIHRHAMSAFRDVVAMLTGSELRPAHNGITWKRGISF